MALELIPIKSVEQKLGLAKCFSFAEFALQVWFSNVFRCQVGFTMFHLRDFSVTGPKAGQLVSTTHIDCELVIPVRVSVRLEETDRSKVR